MTTTDAAFGIQLGAAHAGAAGCASMFEVAALARETTAGAVTALGAFTAEPPSGAATRQDEATGDAGAGPGLSGTELSGGLGASSIRSAVVGVPTADLGVWCGQLLALRALAEGAVVAVALEAVERGVVAESTSVDVAGWVREQGWAVGIGIAPGVAAAIKTVTEHARRRRPADLRPLAAAVVTGRVPVASAKILGRELDLLARRVPDPVWETAAGELIDWAAQGAAPSDLRSARQRIAATYGTQDFEEEQATAKRHRDLSGWVADDAGGWTCRLRTDNEGRAILDAAFDALAGPRPDADADAAATTTRTDQTPAPNGTADGTPVSDDTPVSDEAPVADPSNMPSGPRTGTSTGTNSGTNSETSAGANTGTSARADNRTKTLADALAFGWSAQDRAAGAAWCASLTDEPADDPTGETGSTGEPTDDAGAAHAASAYAAHAADADADAARAAVREALIAAGWITASADEGPADGQNHGHVHAATGADADGDAEIAALGRDIRTPGQRRHDALIEMARILAANPTTLGDVRPTSAVKAQVTITMDYDRLRAGLGPGVDGHGTALTAATVRRMCCDAALIPAVLGADGAILDWGRARRLASPDQVRYLRQRDKGCTFPGCTRPPAWSEAHHLDEWLADRGETNVDRLALLCCRHHDIVHSHHLKGQLRDGRIHWTRRPAA